MDATRLRQVLDDPGSTAEEIEAARAALAEAQDAPPDPETGHTPEPESHEAYRARQFARRNLADKYADRVDQATQTLLRAMGSLSGNIGAIPFEARFRFLSLLVDRDPVLADAVAAAWGWAECPATAAERDRLDRELAPFGLHGNVRVDPEVELKINQAVQELAAQGEKHAC